MGSPCEVLSEATSAAHARELTQIAATEAWRIEDKFSRYIPSNVIGQINSANGDALQVDDETGQLLDFASQLFAISDGLFDVTSGVLRHVWTFDGSDSIPTKANVEQYRKRIGWGRISWQSPTLKLKTGMEVDLGGIGKEYAVDRAVQLLQCSEVPCLVNFGGDLAVTRPPQQRMAWTIGIDAGTDTSAISQTQNVLQLTRGALATSGDAQRYLEKDGVRYSHVLDPRTGWPVEGAASSVTVAAATCVQAGMLATIALLKGPAAELFLAAQSEKHWVSR